MKFTTKKRVKEMVAKAISYLDLPKEAHISMKKQVIEDYKYAKNIISGDINIDELDEEILTCTVKGLDEKGIFELQICYDKDCMRLFKNGKRVIDTCKEETDEEDNAASPEEDNTTSSTQPRINDIIYRIFDKLYDMGIDINDPLHKDFLEGLKNTLINRYTRYRFSTSDSDNDRIILLKMEVKIPNGIIKCILKLDYETLKYTLEDAEPATIKGETALHTDLSHSVPALLANSYKKIISHPDHVLFSSDIRNIIFDKVSDLPIDELKTFIDIVLEQ